MMTVIRTEIVTMLVVVSWIVVHECIDRVVVIVSRVVAAAAAAVEMVVAIRIVMVNNEVDGMAADEADGTGETVGIGMVVDVVAIGMVAEDVVAIGMVVEDVVAIGTVDVMGVSPARNLDRAVEVVAVIRRRDAGHVPGIDTIAVSEDKSYKF